MSSRNSDRPIGPEDGPDELQQPVPEPEVEEHEFQKMAPEQKLERLLSLYFGVVGRLEDTRRQVSGYGRRLDDTRRWMANHELEYRATNERIVRRLEYVAALQATMMHSLGVAVPKRPETEPPPPPADEEEPNGEGHNGSS